MLIFTTAFQHQMKKKISSEFMRIAALFRYMNTSRIYVLKSITTYYVYALALLLFISHINVPSETKIRDNHFIKNFRDCICTEFYNQSRY